MDPRAKGEATEDPAVVIWSPLADLDRFSRWGPYPDDVTPEKDDCRLGGCPDPKPLPTLISPLECCLIFSPVFCPLAANCTLGLGPLFLPWSARLSWP